jgi:hypothetical protein
MSEPSRALQANLNPAFLTPFTQIALRRFAFEFVVPADAAPLEKCPQ